MNKNLYKSWNYIPKISVDYSIFTSVNRKYYLSDLLNYKSRLTYLMAICALCLLSNPANSAEVACSFAKEKKSFEIIADASSKELTLIWHSHASDGSENTTVQKFRDGLSGNVVVSTQSSNPEANAQLQKIHLEVIVHKQFVVVLPNRIEWGGDEIEHVKLIKDNIILKGCSWTG